MVDASGLKVGDRVVIVDKWRSGCNQNISGLMDKYLGTTMTISKVLDVFGKHGSFRMEEDGGRWAWNERSISHLEEDDFDLPFNTELCRSFCSLFGGG